MATPHPCLHGLCMGVLEAFLGLSCEMWMGVSVYLFLGHLRPLLLVSKAVTIEGEIPRYPGNLVETSVSRRGGIWDHPA